MLCYAEEEDLRSLILAGSLAFFTVSAFATITFSGLPGANGDPFTTYTEDGFIVNPTTGSWEQGFNFGNPTPSIFSGSSTASITITGGLFTFSSFDFGNGNSFDGLTWSVAGFLSGTQVLTGSGNGPVISEFETIASPNTSTTLDTLVLTANLGNTTSFNFDNIVLIDAGSAVPEPAAISLVAAGALLIVALRRRRLC
jgi:hypothetical protein